MPSSQGNSSVTPNFRSWVSGQRWRERVIAFDPSWFVVTMGTGVVVQILYYFPYPAYWLNNLSYVFWILDIVLVVFFTFMGCLRLVMYPKVAVSVLDDFQQTAYLGAIPISFSTIAAGLVLHYNEYSSAVYAAEAIFWIDVVMSVAVSLGGSFAMYQHQDGHKLEQVTGVWLLSFIPLIVAASLGSALTAYTNGGNLATILFVSFLMWSLGLGLALVIITIYYWRLIACNLPPRDAIVSVFVPVGPLGMGAFTIFGLGLGLARYVEASGFVFEESYTQPFNSVSHGAVVQMIIWVGVLVALMLLGIASFFLIEAFASVSSKVPKSFSIGWWSFVFPCGVYANAFCRLSSALRNNAMKGWASACVVGTVLLWLMCAFVTTYKGVWQGKTFSAPGLQGYVEKQEEEQRNKSQSSQADTLSDGGSKATGQDEKDTEGVQVSPDGTYRRLNLPSKNNEENNV